MSYKSLLFALGNPESQYGQTRHNAGIMVLNRLASAWNCSPFVSQTKFCAGLTEKSITSDQSILLAKSESFMNESGVGLATLSRFYKIEPTDIFVIHDDLDLELGNYKIQFDKGPKEHNGLASVYEKLGTKAVWHVRVGVDNRGGDRTMPPKDYVLQRFTPLEQGVFDEVMSQLVADLTSFWQL